MKNFFEQYLLIPFSILLFLFITPTVLVGGISVALYFAGILPDMGICHSQVENE